MPVLHGAGVGGILSDDDDLAANVNVPLSLSDDNSDSDSELATREEPPCETPIGSLLTLMIYKIRGSIADTLRQFCTAQD